MKRLKFFALLLGGFVVAVTGLIVWMVGGAMLFGATAKRLGESWGLLLALVYFFASIAGFIALHVDEADL